MASEAVLEVDRRMCISPNTAHFFNMNLQWKVAEM